MNRIAIFVAALFLTSVAYADQPDKSCSAGGERASCRYTDESVNATGGSSDAHSAAIAGAFAGGGHATQGQVGINSSTNRIGEGDGSFSATAVRGNVESSVQESGNSNVQVEGNRTYQGQIGLNKQDQTSVGTVDSHDTFDARDQSSTLYEAQERDPVSSAASVSASACASGVSAQGVDLGGAVARVNPYCNLSLTIEKALSVGDRATAKRMVILMSEMAEADARGIGGFRTFVRGLPILGGVLGFIF